MTSLLRLTIFLAALLIGRLDQAEHLLAELEPTPFPAASSAAHELVVAGIAMRRLRTKAARCTPSSRVRRAPCTYLSPDGGG